jgi:hypothetical protein
MPGFVGDGELTLAFMRYTGQWVQLFEGLSATPGATKEA